MALSLFKSQLPSLIEKFEPELEKALRDTLRAVKASNPSEAQLFLTNWKKLDAAIKAELESPAPAPVAPVMTGGDESSGPTGPVAPIPEPSPPIIEPTGPTGPTIPEATGPSFMQPSGASGPTMLQNVVQGLNSLFGASGPTGPELGGTRKLFAPNGGSYKAGRRRKTAKQHKKRTHRIKHKKH